MCGATGRRLLAWPVAPLARHRCRVHRSNLSTWQAPIIAQARRPRCWCPPTCGGSGRSSRRGSGLVPRSATARGSPAGCSGAAWARRRAASSCGHRAGAGRCTAHGRAGRPRATAGPCCRRFDWPESPGEVPCVQGKWACHGLAGQDRVVWSGQIRSGSVRQPASVSRRAASSGSASSVISLARSPASIGPCPHRAHSTTASRLCG